MDGYFPYNMKSRNETENLITMIIVRPEIRMKMWRMVSFNVLETTAVSMLQKTVSTREKGFPMRLQLS